MVNRQQAARAGADAVNFLTGFSTGMVFFAFCVFFFSIVFYW